MAYKYSVMNTNRLDRLTNVDRWEIITLFLPMIIVLDILQLQTNA